MHQVAVKLLLMVWMVFLVPVKDANALAAAMLRFIEQLELIAEMGKCSREIAEEKYDVHKVNKQMIEGMRL